MVPTPESREGFTNGIWFLVDITAPDTPEFNPISDEKATTTKTCTFKWVLLLIKLNKGIPNKITHEAAAINITLVIMRPLI